MIKLCANCETSFEAKRDRSRFCSDICRASFHQVVKGANGEIIVKIYALINPVDDSVFYIGKTIGTLEARLKAHLKNKENIERTKIIDTILKAGLLPNIIELEKILCSTVEEETNALLREDFWIKHHIGIGAKLCNVQGVKSMIKPRLLTSYQKESEKSRPSGIRFDKDQLEFIQKKEIKLTTKQKVVDFLLNKYWWEFKIARPTHKDVPPDELKLDVSFMPISEKAFDGSKVNRTLLDEQGLWGTSKPTKNSIKRTPAHWVELRRDCDDADSYAKWLDDLENDTFLSTREKSQIKQTT